MALVVLSGPGMPTARKYQELIAWQLSTELCDVVFEITRAGAPARDREFRDQIRNAAKKAPALICEGFVRFTDGEFIRYLRMARAELAEVQNHLDFARRQGYVSEAQLARAEPLARRAIAATTRLLQSKLRNQQSHRRRSAARDEPTDSV